MVLPLRARAWIGAGLTLLVGGVTASAQTTQPASPVVRRVDRLPQGGSAPPAVPGQRIRISRGGGVQVSNGRALQAASGEAASKYSDGVYRIGAESPNPSGEQRRQRTVGDENGGGVDDSFAARSDWYDRWQAACGGYSAYEPSMIYPDDLVFYNAHAYRRGLEAGNRAGKDIGRRETLFKGALDIYNERMGNPPAPTAGAPGWGGPGYPYAVPPSWDAYSSGYRAGQYQGELWLARDRNLLRTARLYVEKGQELFRAGKYEEAIEAFRLAASSDHGDASSRLLAAHAYFAVGRYGPAMSYLRRAFELQPKIAFLDYSIHAEYGNVPDFDKHLEALKKACEDAPKDYQMWALLGYVYRHSGNREASAKALTRAYTIEPRDKVVRSLLDVEPDPKK